MTVRTHAYLAADRAAKQLLRLLGDPVAGLGSPRWYADPYPLLERMRSRGPLWKSLSGMWVATSYDVCSSLLLDRRIGVRHRDGRPPYSWPGEVQPQRDKEHLAFASGAHYCLGAPLARLEGAVAFKTLATKLPGLRRNGPVTWRPSSLVRGITALPVTCDTARMTSGSR